MIESNTRILVARGTRMLFATSFPPNGDPPASGGSSPRLPNATGNRAGAGGCTASEHMESPA